MQNKKVTASAIISELQSSDMYIQVRGRLCDMKTNANGVAVTEAFIDEIIANEDKYIGIPLCADVRGLLNNKNIGHMYNRATGEFMSTIVGSMIHFEKEVENGNASLIINARIMKRYKAVCAAIANLFAEGRLKFSFEITCGDYEELDDGTMVIDASDLNYLEGAAIVTFPACEDAVAMELVAECLRKEGENMADQELIVETAEAEAQTEAVAEVEQAAVEEVPQTEETAEVEPVVETATTIVRQEHTESDCVHTYDTETGVETHECITHEVCIDGPVETMASDSEKPATEVAEEPDEEEDKEEEKCECNAESAKEKTAAEACDGDDEKDEECNAALAEADSVPEGELLKAFAELKDSLQSIRSELAALKEHYIKNEVTAKAEASPEELQAETIIADQEKKWTLVNPFVSNMSVPPNKYRLLEKEEGRKEAYTLI